MTPLSPITNKDNVKKITVLETGSIIDKYKKYYDIDVEKYFRETSKIAVYQCLDSGYQFYYPDNIIADQKFYEHFSNYAWYYMDEKWEFEIAETMIEDNDVVLEIGCGQGSFLNRLRKRGINAVALETGMGESNHIFNQTIEGHVLRNRSKYTVVCSFQVLEHIPQVKGHLNACLDALKTGGSLIISVPINWSISPIFKDNILNMPPHHQGLWSINSLISLTNFFPIRLKKLEIEPLQYYHRSIFVNYLNKTIIPNSINLSKIISQLAKPLLTKTVKVLSQYIIGHSVLVQYIKE